MVFIEGKYREIPLLPQKNIQQEIPPRILETLSQDVWKINEFSRILSLNPSPTEIPDNQKILDGIDKNIENLEELRYLHGLTNPVRGNKYFGSISLHHVTEKLPNTLKDVSDQTYQISLSEGEQYYRYDFIPFGIDKKIDKLAIGARYLGLIDFARMIKYERENSNFPRIIGNLSSSVNAARFSVNSLGFHLAAVHVISNGVKKVYTGEEALQFFNKQKQPGENDKILFEAFAKREDLFTDEKVKDLYESAKDVFEGQKKVKFLDQEVVEGYTQENYGNTLRQIGIIANIKKIKENRRRVISVVTEIETEIEEENSTRRKKEAKRKNKDKMKRISQKRNRR